MEAKMKRIFLASSFFITMACSAMEPDTQVSDRKMNQQFETLFELTKTISSRLKLDAPNFCDIEELIAVFTNQIATLVSIVKSSDKTAQSVEKNTTGLDKEIQRFVPLSGLEYQIEIMVRRNARAMAYFKAIPKDFIDDIRNFSKIQDIAEGVLKKLSNLSIFLKNAHPNSVSMNKI